MRYDFTYMQALQSKARRERSEAMYEMLISPLVALFTRKSAKKALHHAPRPHLARQG
jgi:hypothetical protein